MITENASCDAHLFRKHKIYFIESCKRVIALEPSNEISGNPSNKRRNLVGNVFNVVRVCVSVCIYIELDKLFLDNLEMEKSTQKPKMCNGIIVIVEICADIHSNTFDSSLPIHNFFLSFSPNNLIFYTQKCCFI